MRHAATFFSLALALASGCASSSAPCAPDGSVASGAGLVAGPADAHCSAKKQAVSAASCHDAGAAAPVDDAGALGEYGATLFNGEGDEDDCKYHVTWSAPSVAQRANVTLSVSVSSLAEGTALRGAPIRAEVFLDDTHPAPNTNQTSAESASLAGTYASSARSEARCGAIARACAG